MSESTYSSRFRIPPGETVSLAEHASRWEGDAEFKSFDESVQKSLARQMLEEDQSELASLQDRLYASSQYGVLLILEGMIGADLDGVIRRVFSGINPQGCSVNVFRKPSDEEQEHDFLWRYFKAMPGKGHIGIYKKSYYSELAYSRPRPEIRQRISLPSNVSSGSFWRDVTRSINALEHHLSPTTLIIKIFLHISREQQAQRFLKWIDDPTVRWKFNGEERDQHKRWDEYLESYQAVINATHTRWAPWYVIPADLEWVAQTLVADILANEIRSLGVSYPQVGEEQMAVLAEGRKRLESE